MEQKKEEEIRKGDSLASYFAIHCVSYIHEVIPLKRMHIW